MNFSTYDLATGRIERQLTMPVDMAAVNIDPETEGLIEGHADPAAVYLRDGELANYPARPGPWAVYDYGAHVWTDPRTAEDHAAELAEAKAVATASLLATCSDFERLFVTPLPAQQMKYARKEADARAYLADPAPDPADYPWVMAEVGVTAPTAYEVAQVYVNLSGLWTSVAGVYEPIRITHQDMIEAATTISDAQAVVASFKAQMTAVGLPT